MKSAESGFEGLVEACEAKTSPLRRRLFLLSLCICNLSDAVEITCIGYILGYLDGIALIDKELLGSSVIIGMLVGGVVLGQLGDYLGRKTCLQASILTSALAALASAFSPGVGALVAFRIIGGLGIGGVVPALYSLGAELFTKAKKNRMLTIIACCWILGSIYASLVGWIILGDDISGRRISPGLNWRHYAIVCAIPSFLAWLSTFLLVESPLFLMQRGKVESAAVSLSYLSHEEVSVEVVKTYGSQGTGEGVQTASNLRTFIQPPIRYPFILLSLIWFSFSFTVFGVMTWASTLFIQLGFTNPFAGACVIIFSTLPGKIVSIFLIDLTGRRSMLAWGMFFAGLSTLGFAIEVSNRALVLTCASLFGFFISAGGNGLFAITADSYFPTQSRSSAVGFLAAFGRVGALSAQFVFGSMHSNIPALLMISTFVTFFGAAMALILPACNNEKQSDRQFDRQFITKEDAFSPMGHHDTIEMGDSDATRRSAATLAVEY